MDDMTEISNSEYEFCRLRINRKLETMTYYTITVYGNIEDTLSIYMGNGSNGSTGTLKKISEGVYSCIVKRDYWTDSNVNDLFVLYSYMNYTERLFKNTIYRAKIELGANANPIWTPNMQNFKTSTEVVEGEYLNVEVQRYGQVVNVHTAIDPATDNITLKKELNKFQYVLAVNLPDYCVPIGNRIVSFGVTSYPIEHNLIGRISANGNLEIWTDGDTSNPNSIEIHLNATYIAKKR